MAHMSASDPLENALSVAVWTARELQAENARLAAIVDELAKDKARMDWITAHQEDLDIRTTIDKHKRPYVQCNVTGTTVFGDTLRQAIDGAMQGSKEV